MVVCNRKVWEKEKGPIPQGMCIMQLGNELVMLSRREQCRIVVNGKRIQLGLFDTEEQAHLAYQTKLAEIEHSENPKEEME